ncbi:MAG: Riboflavin transporter RibN [Thermodesulfobacterium sp.]|uniref:Riboflavin transporter RibN n=1 Tax=Candidatus Thermodesulfobacterium syntrophicum TaxID=3060442 RepID=A0AAE3TDU5_9BACT|nr:Riboflavin transporter RibN [Candidatus Thermodesulfobacterium syntrophicum]
MEKNVLILWFLTIIFWGVSPVIEKFGLKDVQPLPALFIRTLAALIGIFLALLLSSSVNLSSLNSKNIGMLSLSGIIGGFLGMFTYFSLLKAKNASQIVPLTSTYPLIATLLAVLFLKEELTLYKILGTIFVVIGIYFLFKS